MVRISQRPEVVTVIKPSRPLVSRLIAQAEKAVACFSPPTTRCPCCLSLMAEEQTSRQYLRAALEAGERNLQGLRLGGVDGLDLDLSDCNLEGSCFKEARFGHACLRGAQVQRCCF
jgi:hypothetical protein